MSVVLAVLDAALISSFLSPDFGPNVASVPTFLGFVLGLAIVLVAFELPPIVMRWRTNGEVGRLRVLPWTLAVAAAFVLVSRIFELQPGYLYGLVLGVTFSRSVSPAIEARETVVGTVATLLLAIAAWLVLEDVRASAPADDAIATVVQTATAAIVVSGLEAVAFGMLPVRFMPGQAVYAWSRSAWAVLFGVGMFAFVQILVGPTSGYLAELTPQAWLAGLGVFAAFGAFTLLFWAWFRFRPTAGEAASEV
jgi:hypothetical protein